MAGEEGHMKEKQEKEAAMVVTKRMAAEPGSSEGGKGAAAAAAMAEAAAGDGDEDAAPKVKYVEMPKEYLSWILAQERESGPLPYDPTESTLLLPEEIERDRKLIAKMNASLQATDDEFFEFQTRIRGKFEKNGRVIVPEDFLP